MTAGCWIDGLPEDTVEVTDRGLHYGDGLFETLAVRQGQIVRLASHLDRLLAGCARLALPAPDRDTLQRELELAASGADRAVLKLMLTRGSGGRGYRPPEEATIRRIILRYPWPHYPPAWSESGIELRICRTRLGCNPALAGLKHLNRLEQVLARNEWQGEPPEGLMLDSEGRVVAGTMTNAFAVTAAGSLLTPDLGRAGVAGVTRGFILTQAQRAGMGTSVRDVALQDFLEQPEIFMCNAIAGVWPVIRVESRRFSPGEITRRVQRWVAED